MTVNAGSTARTDDVTAGASAAVTSLTTVIGLAVGLSVAADTGANSCCHHHIIPVNMTNSYTGVHA